MSNPINFLYIFEGGAFIFFFLILARKIYQKNYSKLFEIISCSIFGMILEIANIYFSHNYSYSQNFLISIAGVPLAIGLGWGVIIYSAMLLSDQYNIPWKIRPFMDALTAVVLDIAIDPVAIRLGFWNWKMPLGNEWYGVPFENLAGWIFVTLSFSFVIRFIRTLISNSLFSKFLFLISS